MANQTEGIKVSPFSEGLHIMKLLVGQFPDDVPDDLYPGLSCLDIGTDGLVSLQGSVHSMHILALVELAQHLAHVVQP